MTLKYEIEYRDAISLPRKIMEYRKHGQLHRLNGPAIIFDDGNLRWLQYNKHHRETGPAVLWSDDVPSRYITT